jgi:hypothetical protein
MNFSKAAYKEKTCPAFDTYLTKHNRKMLNRLHCSIIQKCQMVNDRKDIGVSLNNIIPEQQCSQQNILSVAPKPISGLGRLIVEVPISLTDTNSRWDSSEQVISSSQRPLPTQQTQQANIHSVSGIQTHDPSNRTAEDLRLTRHGHRRRLSAEHASHKRCYTGASLSVAHSYVLNILNNSI